MKEFIKKHWLYLLGSTFIIISLLYFLKYAIELNTISNIVKTSIGMGTGVCGIFALVIFRRKIDYLSRELISGVSMLIIYASIITAGVDSELWNQWMFFAILLVTSILTLFISQILNQRIFSNLSLIGLIAPLFLTLSSNKIVFLALYLWILSIFYFIVSLKKSWLEIRIISFIGSWFVYYNFISTNINTLNKNSYLIADIIIYVFLTGLLMYSISYKNRIKTIDYVLSIYNGFIFIRYLPKITEFWYVKSAVLMSSGVIYIISAVILYYLFENARKHFLLKFIIGSFFILLAAMSIDFDKEFISLYISYIWTFAILLLILFRKLFDITELKVPIFVLWFASSLYWFVCSFTLPLVKLFGIFIPILNWSGLVSILLSAIGFIIVSDSPFGLFEKSSKTLMPTIIRLSSHVIICGLLANDIDSFLKEYKIFNMEQSFILTLIWSIYSLVLLVRAIYNNQIVYKNFAIFILLISSFKAFFIDLSSSRTIYKMIFLFVLGIITLLVAGLNKKTESITN